MPEQPTKWSLVLEERAAQCGADAAVTHAFELPREGRTAAAQSYQWLTGSAQGFLRGCRALVLSAVGQDALGTLARWESDMVLATKQNGTSHEATAARVLTACTRAVLDRRQAATHLSAAMARRNRVDESEVRKPKQAKGGDLQALVRAIRSANAKERWEWTPIHDLAVYLETGEWPAVDSAISIQVPVDAAESGKVVLLHVARSESSLGDFAPQAQHHLWYSRDDQWREAERQAWDSVEQWRQADDKRASAVWWLSTEGSTKALPRSLTGPSVGAGLAGALRCLFCPETPKPNRQWAVTAALVGAPAPGTQPPGARVSASASPASTRLGSVGSEKAKVLACAESRVRNLMVSSDDVPKFKREAQGIRSRSRVRVHGAASVEDALRIMRTDPRRRAWCLGGMTVMMALGLGMAGPQLWDWHVEVDARATIRAHVLKSFKLYRIDGKELSWEKDYVVLPLRHAVKTDESPMRRRDAFSEDAQLLPDLRGWTDASRGTGDRVEWEEVPLEDALTLSRRVIAVTAPPGGGKTTLLKYLAVRCAKGEWQYGSRQLVPLLIPLEEWADEVRDRPSTGLAELVGKRYCVPSGAVRDWLRGGDALLLLDGVDEVAQPGKFWDRVNESLRTYDRCPAIITSRTASWGDQIRCDEVFELAPLNEETEGQLIRCWFPGEQADTIAMRVGQSPALGALATNPLLLHLMCYAAQPDGGKEPTLPDKRVELYDRLLRKLLLEKDRGKPRCGLPVDRQMAVLGEAALHFFVEGEGRSFSEADMLSVFTRSLSRKEWGYGSPGDRAEALLTDLTGNSGLVERLPDGRCFLLHLTIQEYLAACALAERLAKAPVPSGTDPWDLVDRKAWLPQWQEVIALLAGKLANPGPLLRLLADKKKDDYFRHRLALAALCLGEVPPSRLRDHGLLVEKIGTSTFSLWWQYSMTNSAPEHLTRALPALAQVNGPMNGRPLLEWLGEALRDSRWDVRLITADALSSMGRAIGAHPDVLPVLAAALLDSFDAHLWDAPMADSFEFGLSSEGRASLVRAREAWEAIAHHPKARAVVVAALRDADTRGRLKAAEALNAMGEAVGHPDVLPILLAALHDPDAGVRSMTAYAMRKAAADHRQVACALMARMHDPDKMVRRAAAWTLGQFGEVAGRDPNMLPVLAELVLHDPDREVRSTAAHVLARMGKAAGRQVVSTLAAGLHDTDKDVRGVAAWTLGQFGEVAARDSDMLSALAGLVLHDPDGEVRSTAVNALGEMGRAVAAHRQVVCALMAGLHDTDKEMRHAAALTLGRLGEVIARHSEMLSSLVELALRDPDREVRWSAAFALGEMGKAVGDQHQVVSALMAGMHDTAKEVRSAAVRTLGFVGEVAARHPELLASLLAALHDTDLDDRDWAARALGEAGGPAARRSPEVLASLLTALHDTDYSVRGEAARALGRLGKEAARDPRVLPALVELALDDTHAMRLMKVAGVPDDKIGWLFDKAGVIRRARVAARNPRGFPALVGLPPDDLKAISKALLATADDASGDQQVRWHATEALGRLGWEVARDHPMLPVLMKLALDDTDHTRRMEAVRALGSMMAHGVRIFQRREGKWEVCTVTELSQ
jgi:HEAT repeat protein